MNKETKEEVGWAVGYAAFLLTLIVLVVFLWSPIIHYLEKWNEWWNTPVISEVENEVPSREIESNYSKAKLDCNQRAAKHFKTHIDFVAVFASSTSESKYETYDCYGVKYEKI